MLFTLDPSLYAFCDEILAGQYQVKCPVLTINSEYFTHYSNMQFKQWDCVMAVMNGAKDSGRQENIIIKEQRHLDQCDAGTVCSWEKQVFMQKRWPRGYLPDLYILNSQLLLSFLSKLDTDEGNAMYFDASKVN